MLSMAVASVRIYFNAFVTIKLYIFGTVFQRSLRMVCRFNDSFIYSFNISFAILQTQRQTHIFLCFSLVAPFNIIILSSSSSSSAQPLEFRSRLFVFIISDSQGHSITTKPLTALFPLKLLVTVQDSDRLWPGTLFFSFFPSFFFSRNLCGFSPQRPLGVWVCARCFLLILFFGGGGSLLLLFQKYQISPFRNF